MEYRISNELAKAREYEKEQEALIKEEDRPVYHFTPRTGWLNDPNGLSYYDGKYHLFYQYHPYDSHWGPMHWGHAVSKDMIRWKYLPCALAPDTEYDGSGCFSGSALVMDDGSHLLMYTGCGDSSADPTGKGRWIQSQNIAIKSPGSDEYIKYGKNPVIKEKDLPEGGDAYEFRDPYLWRAEDGTFRVLVANGRTDEETGTQLTMYRSDDGFNWGSGKVLFEDERRIGVMWECPNFFPLGDKHVLIASPMDMQAEEEEAVGSIRFPQGNNVCYITGKYDKKSEDFTPDSDDADTGYYIYEPVDGGLDFYAPQVMKTPDGRHVMIGWMQDPMMGNLHDVKDFRIFGQMTVPRELSMKNGRLHQWPVRELEEYRTDKDIYNRVAFGNDWIRIPSIRGRAIDLTLDIKTESTCEELGIRFAADKEHHVELRFDVARSVLTIDRSNSGQPDNITKKRSLKVRDRNGKLSLRLLIDRYSAEIFINDGEQTMSVTYYTDPSAQDVYFKANGPAYMDIEKYDLQK